jgi:hypothetical protein
MEWEGRGLQRGWGSGEDMGIGTESMDVIRILALM